MKKFLVFLVSIIVVVCFGLTTYYFMRNDEIIIINTKELYCNAGDIISLDALKMEVKKPNKKTKYNYNAASSEVLNKVSYNEESGCYVVSETAGGEVDLVISTNNKRYAELKVKLHIGNGTSENPYYIFSQSELSKIGSVYRLDSNYSLMNNISLTSDFMPIGYSEASSSWIGFSGNFNGNGKTISNLNLTSADYVDAGLFSSINASATVSDLKINNATINGVYTTAGILAGNIAGNVDRIAVTNSTITNTAANSYTGSLAGVYSANNLKLSYADNVTITVEEATDVTIGGLVGKLVETTASATYANNIKINTTNTTGLVGGYAGEFVIGTNSGSVLQSYANTACGFENFAGFVGKVSTSASFDASKANMLSHFIGNIAVVANKASNADIADTDVIKEFDNSYFKNETYPTASVFFNPDASMYLIRGYISAGNVVETNEYVYYAVNSTNITMWDTNYVWKTNSISMPTLILGSIEPNGVSGDYFRKDLSKVEVTEDINKFENIFSTDVKDKNIQLLEDVTLTDWTPVALTNCTIDGNNKTIYVNLSNAKENYLGLFTVLDNCTIENLNVVVTGVSANATYAGAIAGKITSSAETISTIKNVNITYQNNFGAVAITEFGGVVGNMENTEITGITVNDLIMNSNSKVEYAGSVVGKLVSGSINNVNVTATIYGTTYVGGVAGENKGSISNIIADVALNNVVGTNNCLMGGVAARNEGAIIDATANVAINVLVAGKDAYAGNVAAINDGSIESVSVAGAGVSVANVDKTVYVGGVVASNNGSINSTYNTTTKIGDYYVGKNIKTAGVAVINNGDIQKVLTSSNIYGNYVAGVVVEMNATGKTIDQVVVGNYEKETKTLTRNSIKGDKYVAGVAVDFKAGKISNVQTASALEGATTSTRTSLIVLVFPNGAEITTSTINNKMSGYGTFYRDTWTDFASYTNKAEFGYTATNASNVSYFNAYKSSAYCGKITNVVINSDYKSSGISVKQAMGAVGNIIGFIPGSNDYNGVNNIKETSKFTTYSEFTGNFTFNCAYNSLYNSYVKETATLNFSVGSVWENNNGISLMFLNNVK